MERECRDCHGQGEFCSNCCEAPNHCVCEEDCDICECVECDGTGVIEVDDDEEEVAD